MTLQIAEVAPTPTLTVTFTPTVTGLFIATGSIRFEQDEGIVIVFNSDDATDAMSIDSWSSLYTLD